MRFVTIVPHVENLELRKDTGQIPYQLYNLCGYDSTLVTYFFTLEGRRKNGPVNEPPSDKQTISENYPYLTSEVPGLKLHFLKNKGRGKFYEKAIFDYLLGNAKKIDVLNLFHFNAENIFYSIIYKFLNPKGRLYLKLDIDIEYYKSRKHFFNTAGPLANFKIFVWEKVIYRIFFKIAHT